MTSMICFLFAPFLLLLRHPPILNEEQVLLQSGVGVKYTAFPTDSPDDVSTPLVLTTKLMTQQPAAAAAAFPSQSERRPATRLAPPLVH